MRLESHDRETDVPILRDIPISLTAERILSARPGGKARTQEPALRRAAQEAAEMAMRLVEPAAVYDESVVVRVPDGAVLLRQESGQAQLTVGPRATLLEPAQRLVAAVWTIGAALEERVRDLMATGNMLLAFMLDTAGVMCLGEVGEAVWAAAQERAAALGWGIGPALSPGSLEGWPVEGQRELCALLPLGEIGVSLSPYCVLEPFKSASAVIGMGPGYESTHADAMCDYCTLAETCPVRMANASGSP